MRECVLNLATITDIPRVVVEGRTGGCFVHFLKRTCSNRQAAILVVETSCVTPRRSFAAGSAAFGRIGLSNARASRCHAHRCHLLHLEREDAIEQ
jgi:hypothetical protein